MGQDFTFTSVHIVAQQHLTPLAEITGPFRYVHSMDLSWTFQRHGQQLTLQRREIDGGFELELSGPDAPRKYHFDDLTALERFQSDMECFLVRTGWLLEQFSPDRRTGNDRRTFPRVDVDRRRWWTDGLSRFQTSTSSRRRQKRTRAED